MALHPVIEAGIAAEIRKEAEKRGWKIVNFDSKALHIEWYITFQPETPLLQIAKDVGCSVGEVLKHIREMHIR